MRVLLTIVPIIALFSGVCGETHLYTAGSHHVEDKRHVSNAALLQPSPSHRKHVSSLRKQRRRELSNLPPTKRNIRHLEFIHITKTGGSAIERAAAAAGILWGACHYMSNPWLGCTDPDIARFDRKEFLPMTRFEYEEPWHVPLQYHVVNPFRYAATFAVVRNPYERYVSEYHCPWAGYQGDDRDENAEKMNEFIQHRLSAQQQEQDKRVHFLPQHIYVYHEGRRYVDHVLHFETLSEEFPNLMKFYDLDIVLPPNYHGDAAQRKLTIKDLTRRTIDVINEKAKEDFILFGYEMM